MELSHHVANVEVEGSSPLTRSIISLTYTLQCRPTPSLSRPMHPTPGPASNPDASRYLPRVLGPDLEVRALDRANISATVLGDQQGVHEAGPHPVLLLGGRGLQPGLDLVIAQERPGQGRMT